MFWGCRPLQRFSTSFLQYKKSGLSQLPPSAQPIATKAQQVCWLVLAGVRTSLGVQEEADCGACPKPLGTVFVADGRAVELLRSVPPGPAAMLHIQSTSGP